MEKRLIIQNDRWSPSILKSKRTLRTDPAWASMASKRGRQLTPSNSVWIEEPNYLLLESGARCCAWGHPFFITAVIDITTQHFLFLSFFRDWLAHTLPSAASRIFYSICNTSRLICSSKLTRTSYPIWSIRSKQQFGIVWSQHFTAFCPLFFLNSNILQTNMMNKKEN
jgi:hypothetical protein